MSNGWVPPWRSELGLVRCKGTCEDGETTGKVVLASTLDDDGLCVQCAGKSSGGPSTLAGMSSRPMRVSEPQARKDRRDLLDDPDWMPRLYTCCYSKWKPEYGVPVCTSVGHPRNWRGPQMPQVRAVTPYGLLGPDISRGDYTRRYIERLENKGVAALKEEFRAISADNGGDALVILCFENLQIPGKWCHRRIFAEWWERKTGVAVAEREKDVRPAEQSALF